MFEWRLIVLVGLFIAGLILSDFQSLRIHLKIILNIVFIVSLAALERSADTGVLIFVFLFLSLFLLLFSGRFLNNVTEQE